MRTWLLYTAGSDYLSVMQEIIVRPGQHTYIVQVAAFDDTVKELESVFTLNVTSVDFGDIVASTDILILDTSEYIDFT